MKFKTCLCSAVSTEQVTGDLVF